MEDNKCKKHARKKDEPEQVADIESACRVPEDAVGEVDRLRPDGTEQSEDTLASDPSLHAVPAETVLAAFWSNCDKDAESAHQMQAIAALLKTGHNAPTGPKAARAYAGKIMWYLAPG